MEIVVLGIDLGKNVCSVVGLGAAGQVLVRRRMKRESVVTFRQRWPSSVVAMEACCGAHHLGRQLAAQGHTVRLISPGGFNRSAQHLLILRGEEVCHGDVADLVLGSAESRAVGAMEERAKCCGHLAGAGKGRTRPALSGSWYSMEGSGRRRGGEPWQH